MLEISACISNNIYSRYFPLKNYLFIQYGSLEQGVGLPAEVKEIIESLLFSLRLLCSPWWFFSYIKDTAHPAAQGRG